MRRVDPTSNGVTTTSPEPDWKAVLDGVLAQLGEHQRQARGSVAGDLAERPLRRAFTLPARDAATSPRVAAGGP